MTPSIPTVLDPVQLGRLSLRNRVVMAPMTRARVANAGGVPGEMNALYYAQRASAGLIVSEGTWPSREAIGATSVPGLYTAEQAAGWQTVTSAVHAAGGRIFSQLGHTGAASHPDHLDGQLPLAPSAINPGLVSFTRNGAMPTVTPRAMTADDIARTIADYAKAARLARQAGFDGVELHGTVSYLLPQFLSSALNQRDDEYGGNPANRARFPLAVLKAIIAEWGPGQVAMRLSPGITMGNLALNDQTLPTYEYLVKELVKLNLAYLHLQHPTTDLSNTPVAALSDGTAAYFRQFYPGTLIANGGFTYNSANAAIASGVADLVSFGAPYLANPDLVERFASKVALAECSPELYYMGGAKGYTDFPRAT